VREVPQGAEIKTGVTGLLQFIESGLELIERSALGIIKMMNASLTFSDPSAEVGTRKSACLIERAQTTTLKGRRGGIERPR